MRYALAFTMLFLIPGFAGAEDPAERLDNSPRHHDWVDVKTSDGRTVKCYVVFPEVSEAVPAVIVIHEIFGLTDWARSATDQVAEAGYVAIAPDMLSGTGPEGGGSDSYASQDASRKAVSGLDAANVMSSLDAAFEYAKQMDAANGKVAVGGFCWGGGQSFAYAAHNADLAAAFVFYGRAAEASGMESIACPVYGFYGGNDFRITGGVPETAEKMKELGKTYDPVIYKDAGHGFMRAGEADDASTANRTARDEAWERWKKLLGDL